MCVESATSYSKSRCGQSKISCMLELLMVLLKEEREKRKQIEKDLGESNNYLISKIHDLETDIVLERCIQVIVNMQRHGHIECDDASGFNVVDTLSI